MADSQPPPQHNGSEQPPPSEDNIKTEPDLDASIEQDVEMNPEQPDEAPAVDPIAPAPTPSKKETSLREFLGRMDDYAPIVCPPDSQCPSQHSANQLRFRTPLLLTTSLLLVSHPQAQGPVKRPRTSRASLRSPLRSSSLISPRTPTSLRASAPQTALPRTMPLAVWPPLRA